MKVKEFFDEEGSIIEVSDGEGREKGLALFNVRNNTGKLFNVRPKGNFSQRAFWFTHPEECIGKRYTYRYFELTEYGIPRFPVGIAFRDYEGKNKVKDDHED